MPCRVRRTMMRALISTAILALTMGPIGSAWGQSNMEVIGHIKATLDGDSREWQTFKSRADGRTVGSANWQRMTFTMPDMSDFFCHDGGFHDSRTTGSAGSHDG